MTWLRRSGLGRLFGAGRRRGETPSIAVVGLGNPGSEYEDTRHNAGFRCVDVLAARHGVRLKPLRKAGLAGEGTIQGRRVVLVKPLTFVNRSGPALRALAEEYGLPPSLMLVVYDEMDLDPGALRLRPSGGSGGHKGLKSIIESLSTHEFPRIRIGVGRPRGHDTIDHVLGVPSRHERALIDEGVERAADAVPVIMSEGMEAAMNRFNRAADGG